MLEVVGITPTHQRVVSGVFTMVDTHGLPVDMIISYLLENDMVPNWFEFVIRAKLAGWKNRTILSKVEEAVGTVHGPSYRDKFMVGFTAIVECSYST